MQGLDVPVVVHSGVGMPAANLAMWIFPARELPQLKVVLAHCGHGVLAGKVSVAASVCDNVFMDTSSTGSKTIAGYIKRFGAQQRQILFREHAARGLHQSGRWSKVDTGYGGAEQIEIPGWQRRFFVRDARRRQAAIAEKLTQEPHQ
jgi:hypothetical protein